MKRTKGKWTDENDMIAGHIYNGPSTEELRANEKLIAAAPEMLEALIMLKNGLDYMQQTDDGEHILNAEYVELITKTINKATL